MPYSCTYCNTALSSRRNLELHQSSARYCIEIQKANGVIVDPKCYECECGSNFTQKSNLKEHQKICTYKESNKLTISSSSNAGQDISQNIGSNVVAQTINQIANQTNNHINNYTINNSIKAFTIQDLTNEYIISTLTPVITKEICRSGIEAITEVVVQALLQKDGKYCYYCTDKSRKKFKMLVDHEGKVIEDNDPNARYLRSILSIPLMKIVGVVAETHPGPKSLASGKAVSRLNLDGKGFISTLSATLPSTHEGIPEVLRELYEKSQDSVEWNRLEKKRLKLNLKYEKDQLIYMNPHLAEPPK